MQKDCKTKKSIFKYCCAANQYHSNAASSLENVLQILPRVVIYKSCLKVNKSYTSIINICNKGLYKRQLVYTTDSSDTYVKIFPTHLTNNFLLPDQSLQISVHIEPKSKLEINKRRHVFITSQHPNITYSVPIIILSKDDKDNPISLPSHLKFPPTTAGNFTYYEMVAYNKSTKKLQFKIKCPLSDLTFHAKSFNILRKDYAKILLKLFTKDCTFTDNCLKLKFNNGVNFEIPFQHKAQQWSMFIDTLNIKFDNVQFERKETKEFTICNESNKDIVFHVDFAPPEENQPKKICEQMKFIDKFAHKHFDFEPCCGTISLFEKFIVSVTFHPIKHDHFLPNDDEIEPFPVISGLEISWRSCMETQKFKICLLGQILGPEIEIWPAILDVRNVYFGEEQSAEIIVINKDEICEAHVDLCGISNWHTARILATPSTGVTLKPKQDDVFRLQLYCTVIGVFLFKLEFKVKYGGMYTMTIKGFCKKVQAKCFPDNLNLDIVPVAIPQKRLVLLMNPLSVPLTVQCTVGNDGSEIPLVLNTHNVKDHLPITVNDPFIFLQQSKAEERDLENLQIEEELEFQYSVDQPKHSFLSEHSLLAENVSVCSEFEKSVLDHVPNISQNLVSLLKAIKILDKSEIENKIMEQALTALLNTPYFIDMDKYKNYTQMDWNSLSSDPKEVYCNTEIIHLKPNTGKAISIVIIPNVVGLHRKYIEMRVCPVVPTTTTTYSELSQIVESDFMTSRLWIEYNCSVPEIIYDNVVIMDDQLYAGETYDFQMVFQNNSNFGGFFYYHVVPQSSLGIMKFPNNEWKYFIQPLSKVEVPCQVKFTKLGSISLHGLIKILGVYATYPFHIKSFVLPPKVKIFPRFLLKTLQVLEFANLYVYIENATPTSTWFKLKLKDELSMDVEPFGAQLDPQGQTLYVTLSTMFQDPGTYKNVLYIIMEFETIEKIPITIHVKGIPIFFEPEIRTMHLDFGHILCNTEEEYYEDKPNFTKVIKIINKGLRCYRFNIKKTKSSAKPGCTITSSKVKITINPSNLIVPALSEISFSISISCCEATTIFSEYRIQLSDQSDIKHMESSRFTSSATFIMPQLSWNRRELTINYCRTHKYKEHEQWETIRLTNITEINMDNVNLKISGPLKIKELFEHKYENELNFSMAGLETKEFIIMLNKEEIRNHLNVFYEGSISCTANLRVQQLVRLKVLVFIPKITLKQNEVILFTKNVEGATYIEITNKGDVSTNYKWKKLIEERHYISEEDDVQQVASLILSDIIRMTDFETIYPELDLETNMTRRYQKYKCLLKELNDPINVKEILHEIIDNLDLKGKRFKLSYQEPLPTADYYVKEESELNDLCTDGIQSQLGVALPMETSETLSNIFINQEFERPSSEIIVAAKKSSNIESCVYYTLDDILQHIKLEDSYDLSLASTDACDLKNSVYFIEKCGLLHQNQGEMCSLHIPPIRRGFEVRAIFQLEVIGGISHQLEITLANLDRITSIDKQHIYLGTKPWYERYQTKSLIENITNYQLSIKVNFNRNNLEHNIPKIALGSNNILGNKMFQLSPSQNTIVRTEGIMGFNEEFKRELNLFINESVVKTIKLFGHGTMPMFIMAKPILPIVKQHPYEVIEEYLLLKKIYYFEIFKTITEKDDEFKNAMEEEANILQEVQSMTDSTLLITDEEEEEDESENTHSAIDIRKEQQFIKLMRSYILVNNNEDLPNLVVLEQLLQTEKFLNQLRFNSEISSSLNTLYQNYLLHLKSCDAKTPIILRHFTIQCLPFQLRTSILNMGKLYLNQYCKFFITLEFIGPGKLIAAARTAIKIPGLTIDFKILENDDKNNFTYYQVDEKITNCDKPYRNVNERLLDRETNPKVKHAHSYDFNPRQQHQRIVNISDVKCIKNYYNSLNKSVYLEQKYHFTHCKITANSKYTSPGTKIKVYILFRPQKIYYEHNQNFEDYIFIDLHMGPTLPILLRALIVDRNRNYNL